MNIKSPLLVQQHKVTAIKRQLLYRWVSAHGKRVEAFVGMTGALPHHHW